MVYFIQRPSGGPIKIGTTIRLSVRLRQLQDEFGEELRILAVVEGDYKKENSLHKRFTHLRLNVGSGREWFEPGNDLVGFVLREGREWDGRDEATSLVPVKMGADVVLDAKIVAAYRDMSLAEYLTELVRPLVARDLENEHAKRVRASKKEGKEK